MHPITVFPDSAVCKTFGYNVKFCKFSSRRRQLVFQNSLHSSKIKILVYLLTWWNSGNMKYVVKNWTKVKNDSVDMWSILGSDQLISGGGYLSIDEINFFWHKLPRDNFFPSDRIEIIFLLYIMCKPSFFAQNQDRKYFFLAMV